LVKITKGGRTCRKRQVYAAKPVWSRGISNTGVLSLAGKSFRTIRHFAASVIISHNRVAFGRWAQILKAPGGAFKICALEQANNFACVQESNGGTMFFQ